MTTPLPASAGQPLDDWRRIDWRFLLPCPSVRSVIYAGITDEDLLRALHLMADDVVPVASPADWSRVPEGSADLVVLVQPLRHDFRAAARAVRPGGWVYGQHRARARRAGAPRTLLGWERAFRTIGLAQIAVYWHAPDFASCSRIVPVGSPSVVRDTLSRHRNVRFGQVKAVLGRLAMSLALFSAVVPEGSIVGRRPETRVAS